MLVQHMEKIVQEQGELRNSLVSLLTHGMMNTSRETMLERLDWTRIEKTGQTEAGLTKKVLVGERNRAKRHN